MQLAAHGIARSEAEIYAGCQTDMDGTLPSAAVRCVQSFGFRAAAQRLAGLAQLQAHLHNTDTPPIVFVNLAPILGINVIHAILVEMIDSLDDGQIHIIDPTHPPTGRRTWTLKQFEVSWRLARNQVILILLQ
jgi:ABC-type bacteriocin/lantibiotic exporter with double-glycine peptidase domain